MGKVGSWEWGQSLVRGRTEGSWQSRDTPLFRTLSEKNSASLKLAEVMNSSQDGSPTSQACGVLDIRPAVSFVWPLIYPRVWKERESVAPPTQ